MRNAFGSLRTRSITLVLAAACAASSAHATWYADGVPICTDPSSQSNAIVVPDGAHSGHVIWHDRRFNEDIFAQRVDASGAPLWTPNGLGVCTESHQQITPFAVSAPGGSAVVFWADHRNGEYDVYAQRIDGSGLGQWGANGIPIATGGDDDERPMAISDGSSGAIIPVGWNVLWVSNDGFSSDLRMNRVNNDGALRVTAASGGTTLVSSLQSLSVFAMASDGLTASSVTRGAVVAWEENRNGGSQVDNIYARRMNGAGTPQWSSTGVAVCDVDGDQQNPAIANVGTSVIIAWDDFRSPDRDIWAQRLDSSGNSLWLADGLPVCQFAGAQSAPRLVSDNSGGVIVAWTDVRSGTSKIYAQRLDANGTRLWTPADGIPLCNAPGAQFNAAIVSDGAGGAIVAWQDRRNGTSGTDDDLYAQRVDLNGNVLWDPAGAPLSRALGNQQFVSLCSDGENGALAAWTDHRGGAVDVYVNRIFSNGAVDVPWSSPTTSRLDFASSNPTRGDVRIRLDLPRPALVTAEVLDVGGRRVRTLCSQESYGVGRHALVWDGADESGERAEAGVFFVRVRAGSESLAARIVRLR